MNCGLATTGCLLTSSTLTSGILRTERAYTTSSTPGRRPEDFRMSISRDSHRPQFNDGNPYYDIQDSISILRGKHTIKFGGEFSHSEADAAILVGGRGIFNFPGGGAFGGSSPSSPLEDFFAGTPTSATLL